LSVIPGAFFICAMAGVARTLADASASVLRREILIIVVLPISDLPVWAG
jgi:hypothetical protein